MSFCQIIISVDVSVCGVHVCVRASQGIKYLNLRLRIKEKKNDIYNWILISELSRKMWELMMFFFFLSHGIWNWLLFPSLKFADFAGFGLHNYCGDNNTCDYLVVFFFQLTLM
jgi:hypothetical protein